MIDRVVGDKNRRVCPNCGYIHFTDPKVGVGVMVLDNDRILLVKRAMKPNQGKWSLPAGYLDYGEDPQATAAREVLEETGMQVAVTGLMDVYYNPESPTRGGASVFILYRARLLGGQLKAGDDAADASFFGPDDLPDLAFDSTRDAISNWLGAETPKS